MSLVDTPLEERVNFLIFGGTGNLSRKKLLPAIYNLYRKKKIEIGIIILLGRKEEKFREIIKGYPEDFRSILKFKKFYAEREESFKHVIVPKGLNVLYLALPPSLFNITLEGIGRHLNIKNKRIVIEKPFGLNLESAKDLNRIIEKYFSEEEIFRIDHFLGKTQVQNILSFKFSNVLFEKTLNSDFVSKVEVIAFEQEGVEGRESYYEEVGALRDMVQNHILLLCVLTAMETPPSPKELPKERERTLKFFKILSEGEILKHYKKGRYKAYKGKVETYVEGVFFVENTRWGGVPFFFKTGKRLKEKRTEIRVFFKDTPQAYSNLFGCKPKKNLLSFNLFPELSVTLRINLISPKGFFACNERVMWSANLRDLLGDIPSPYESLLLEVIRGDKKLFIGKEEVILMWEVIEPILRVWDKVETFVY